jgi:hypothetical protein
MRYALEPMMLAPVFEDDAPMVLFAGHAIALLRADSAKARRAQVFQIAEDATHVDHTVPFVDLRDPSALGRFLSAAPLNRARSISCRPNGTSTSRAPPMSTRCAASMTSTPSPGPR